MVFVGAALLPHAPLLVDGDTRSEEPGCRRRRAKMPASVKKDTEALFNGCQEIASRLEAKGTELIVLHSAEAMMLTDAVAVFMTSPAKGNAEWLGEWGCVQVDIPVDVACSTALLAYLRQHNVPAQGLLGLNGGISSPLGWSEVIPLWFINRALEGKGIKLVLVSVPHSTPMCDYASQAVAIGRHVAAFLDQRPERAAMLVSTDLCHMHDCPPEVTQAPLYMPSPEFQHTLGGKGHGYASDDDLAKAFDASIAKWVTLWSKSRGLDHVTVARAILDQAAQQGLDPILCGLCELFVLHGALEFVNTRMKKTIRSETTAWRTPSYFGMLAAIFEWECIHGP